jgi:uncharacterized protein
VGELVVGFDLDMTLADTRPGVIASFEALNRELGVAIDGDLAASRLGPPLEAELAEWLPAEGIAAAAAVYRKHYATLGVSGCQLLPGAAEAIAAVHAAGGRVMVVTAKSTPLAHAVLEWLGIEVGDVIGDRWGPTKGDALAEHNARMYVGDHASDVAAARRCGAVAVTAATGPLDEAALRDAGADVVFTSLTEFPAWFAEWLRAERLARLEARLRGLGNVLVAFSGGADSAFLLAAAVRTLGPDNVVAATAVSASLPATERSAAAAFAEALGVRHLTPATDEMSREGYRANAGDRCFFCKAELIDVLGPLAATYQLGHVATGTNADDAAAGFRPGIRAAADRGAVTPLLDAGLTKSEIRAISQEWGLVTWDKPAAACLSSRIAYGVTVSPARLARVERAELALRTALDAAGYAVHDLRVRDLGDVARVEIDADLVDAVTARPDLIAAVEGFDAVEIDPRGFRSGSMNEALSSQYR